MANTAKVVLAIFSFVQVEFAFAWHHADPGTSLTIVQALGVMTLSGFDKGEQRWPASCDGIYHGDRESVMTISTKLYTDGSQCHIISLVEVVDQCHNYRDDEVGSSAVVWEDLGLDTNAGVVPVILS
ncbi:hypothetical protein VPH35_107045 [Triticum aestivum]